MSTNQFLRPFGSKRPEVERVSFVLIRCLKSLSLHNHFTSVHDIQALLARSINLAAVQVVPY